MKGYLLGLATLPGLFLLYLTVDGLVGSFTRCRETTCGVCERHVIRKGPFRKARLRAHCRVAHGLALTLPARVRRRQWHGLSQQYASEQGVTDEQWQQAVRAHEQKAKT